MRLRVIKGFQGLEAKIAISVPEIAFLFVCGLGLPLLLGFEVQS